MENVDYKTTEYSRGISKFILYFKPMNQFRFSYLYRDYSNYKQHGSVVFANPNKLSRQLIVEIISQNLIDGEFFHAEDWGTKKKPVTNADFWIPKIERNIERDKEVNAHLQSQGWTVLRFWSRDVKKDLDTCVAIIQEAITKAATTP